MWKLLAYLPGKKMLTRVAVSIVESHGWKMLTHATVAVLAAWGAWSLAPSESEVAEKSRSASIETASVDLPDVSWVSTDTTAAKDTTCSLVPQGLVPDVGSDSAEESSNALPEVEYGAAPPYITVEVTERGPALEVGRDTVTLRGYDPSGTLRSYQYERARRRLSVGPYVQVISPWAGPSLAAGVEGRVDISEQWDLNGRVGIRQRRWTGSLSLTYDLF